MRRLVVLLMLGACGSRQGPFDVTLDPSPEGGVAHDAAILDATNDATKDADGVGWIVPPLATCTAQGSTCLGPPDPGIHASYRKDFFYPYARYPEASLPDPVDGGRVQIAATAKVSGAITQVIIDGQDADVALTTGALDWWHAWPASPNAAGEPIGAEVVGKDAVAEAVRATEAIVVPVFDVAAAASPSDLACATGQDAHFTLAPNSVTVRLTVPSDFGVLDVFELDPSGAAVTVTGTLKGRTLELPMVTLDAARPTRLYVLARSANVRADVTAAYP